MSEGLSNNLDKPIEKAKNKGEVTQDIAENILGIYESYKTKTLFYTKDRLQSLRDMLGIHSQNNYFGASEIQALKNIISYGVNAIIDHISDDSNESRGASELDVEFRPVRTLSVANIFLARANYEQIKSTIEPIIIKFSPLLHLNPELVLAVGAQESKFLPEAESKKGAQGIMQIMPNTMSRIVKFLKTGNTKYAGPEEKYYAEIREKLQNSGINIINYLGDISALEKNLLIGMIYLSYLTSRYGETEGLRIYNGGIKKSNTKENRDYAPGVQKWKDVIVASQKSNASINT